MESSMIFLLALGLDLSVGDPPNRWHPVAWMGRGILWFLEHAPSQGRLVPLVYGGLLCVGMATLAGTLGWLLLSGLSAMPWVRLIVAVFLLKSTFSVRGLIQAAAQVQSALSADDLAEARRLVSWHLVSRDVRSLNREQVAAAAVESVAENLGDGIIAPFFYYTLFGLPGALVHRAVNTCDALYGYHGRYEWVGKVPAHLDDILNFIPARLGALFLLLAGGIGRGNVRQGWRIMWRDHGKTESPNAGWPMSIAAGLLGVELEKVGYYRLGAPASFPDASTIGRIRHLVLIAALCAALVVSVLLVARTYGYRAP